MSIIDSSCPHTRGDDPVLQMGQNGNSSLSPYAWGWSFFISFVLFLIQLVPIRVGMILFDEGETQMIVSCPHTRGDDPMKRKILNCGINLSPYAWGWSYPSKYRRKWRFLVPIRVGMILIWAYVFRVQFTCPHTRGDDPMRITYIINTQGLSPYAWGWSWVWKMLCLKMVLVPIRVGMILLPLKNITL